MKRAIAELLARLSAWLAAHGAPMELWIWIDDLARAIGPEGKDDA